MKKKILVLMLLVSGLTLAQEKTLFNSDISSVKGFGAVVAKYATLNDYGSFLIGGRGGWIFDNSFILGAGIYGLVSSVPVDVVGNNLPDITEDRLHFMYGGAEVEYIYKPKEIVHYSVYTLVGLGTISSHYYNQDYPDDYYDHNHMGNPFFIVEPGFNVILNLTSFLKATVGVSYIATSGADYQTLSDKSISGVSGNVTIKFKGFQ